MPVSDQSTDQSNTDEVPVWHVGPIAKVIGRTPHQTYHLLSRNQVPGAAKRGGSWCLLPSVFRKSFEQSGVAA
jgi:hypothetical protein